ncbi:MAG: folate family ECF transporter S component [Lachnospiraceae bacterium]|nr:folate family ECF transporter S component [Lachnospiraceae bacterium]
MKKKMTVLDITICAAMIALHIVLDLFLTIRIGELYKITLNTLPFVVVGMMCGPAEGALSGLVGCFLSQMLGPYGLMVTTPIWIIPGMLSGLFSGLIYKAFKRKTTIPAIAITVFAAELITTIYNWFGSYLGDVIILKDMKLEVLVAAIPIRLANWALRCVVFTIVLVPLCKTLLKSCPAGIRQAKLNAKAAAEAASASAES